MAAIEYVDVEQQARHVCAYYAILNGIEQLLTSDTEMQVLDVLPQKHLWRNELSAQEVDVLLKEVLANPICEDARDLVFLIDQNSCLDQCCNITFPTVRQACDAINDRYVPSIVLIVNLVTPDQVI